MKWLCDPLRIVLEFIRFLFFFFIGGSIFGGIIKVIYSSFGINVDDTLGGLLVALSILNLLFIVYKNKIQFTGFYKGEGQKSLSKGLSNYLISCSFLVFIIAPLLQHRM